MIIEVRTLDIEAIREYKVTHDDQNKPVWCEHCNQPKYTKDKSWDWHPKL